MTKDTYFNAGYDAGIGRLLLIDYAKGMEVIHALVPESDMQFAIVNSPRYGGSGGSIAVASYAAPEVMAHEVQHSFSALGDEYEISGIAPWEAPNTTQEVNRTLIRWKSWIPAATPVPTPKTPTYSQDIGLFEGAAYNAFGWYRPKQNCRMRENGIPFCEVCSEAVLLSLYDHVSPLDSALPADPSLTIFAGQSPGLRIVVKRPKTHNLKVEWRVDGASAVMGRGLAFTDPLSVGNHKVVARVTDSTPLVRTDPLGLMWDTVSWNVTVSPTTGVPPEAIAPGSLTLGQVGEGAASFLSPAGGPYTLRVLTLSGRPVRWAAGAGLPGWNTATWVGALPGGLYWCEVVAGKAKAGRLFLSP